MVEEAAHGDLYREDQENLNSCMTDFFLRRPVLQSTPPREDKDKAFRLKTTAEIERAWRLIFKWRRRGEPLDSREIQDPDRLKDMFGAWMNEWLDTELTDDQKGRKRSRVTSIFNAWLR